MNKNEPLPDSADDLIDWLDKAYPPRCIGIDQSIESAHRYAGQRELIEKLINWKKLQEPRHVQR